MLTLAKYTTPATRRATVAFQGLDRNAGAGEGWFAHQEGLSTRRHPYLSPAKADKVETFAGAQDVFIWDGVRIVASEGKLWYGEEAVCNVTAGQKQFAVINTKLVVWPDGLAVDLTDRTVTTLAAQAVNRGTAQVTTNSLSLLPESVYAETELRYKSYDERVPWLWVYTSVAWDETAGWTLEGGQWLRADQCEGFCYIPQVAYSDLSGTYTAEYPTSRFSYSAPTGTVEPGNDLGFYGKVADVVEYERTASSFYSLLAAQIYWAQQAGQPLDMLFRVGDAVNVSGTVCGVRDVEKRIIRAIDPETNTLTFDSGTFLAGNAVGRLAIDVADDIGVRWTEGDTTRRYRVINFEGKAGWYAVMNVADTTLRVYDGDWRLQAEYTATSVSSLTGYTVLNMSSMTTTQLPVTVIRPVPELDYICQHDNRLWGVRSADNTIYASALGDPCNFYLYSGLSTDSYAVAVGSQGDFTGICSFGGAVLCWKEWGLHKVLGTLPENYQLATYTLAGVARDSHRSLVTVGQTLYYLGVDGVYSYSGSLPKDISHPLGPERMTRGVGGTDGKCYYLSVLRGQETELLVYDTRLGLWTRRDASRATAFSRSEQGLVCLCGDTLRTLEAGDGVVDWQGELAPMYEDLDRVQYSRVRLRAHLEPGSCLTVEARYDAGRWQRLGLMRASGHRVAELTMPLRRCGMLQLRLSGQGDCTVLELERQYRKRGRG